MSGYANVYSLVQSGFDAKICANLRSRILALGKECGVCLPNLTKLTAPELRSVLRLVYDKHAELEADLAWTPAHSTWTLQIAGPPKPEKGKAPPKPVTIDLPRREVAAPPTQPPAPVPVPVPVPVQLPIPPQVPPPVLTPAPAPITEGKGEEDGEEDEGELTKQILKNLTHRLNESWVPEDASMFGAFGSLEELMQTPQAEVMDSFREEGLVARIKRTDVPLSLMKFVTALSGQTITPAKMETLLPHLAKLTEVYES